MERQTDEKAEANVFSVNGELVDRERERMMVQ